MQSNNKEDCTKEKNKKELTFSVKFNENGESFQKIMEEILISKLEKNIEN